MKEYPWYEIVGNDALLSQGDFFEGCPVVIPCTAIESGTETVAADVIEYDIVVMSQSCDLEYRKVDIVLVCPVWSLGEFGERSAYFKSAEGKEALRRGYSPGYHLLDKCELAGFNKDYAVVDFRNVYGVPFSFLTEISKRSNKRLRLLPPYREHLSQAFARFFMRVGLPCDIPSFA
jgi:hypothetical protein